MPYIGINYNELNRKYVIKVHGINIPEINTTELRNTVEIILENNINNKNLPVKCKILSDTICDIFCDGETILWVTVELELNNGALFGTSSEKLNKEEEVEEAVINNDYITCN